MNEWTDEQSDLASAEGWDVFALDGDQSRLDLERCDIQGIFRDDREALAYIERRAAEGSQLHQHALKITANERRNC